MLSHCLIFLCIGVYASCKPILPPLLSETMAFLEKIMREGTVKFKNESMISLEIPITLEKECALYNLDKFIQALHLLKTEDSVTLVDAYIYMHRGLKAIAKNKAVTKTLQPQNGRTKCELSTININKFLEELEAFLSELHNYLNSN